MMKSSRICFGVVMLFAGLAMLTTNAPAFELVYEAHSVQAFAQPHDITLSSDQRYLYVADNNNDRIAVLMIRHALDPGFFLHNIK